MCDASAAVALNEDLFVVEMMKTTRCAFIRTPCRPPPHSIDVSVFHTPWRGSDISQCPFGRSHLLAFSMGLIKR
jgi:hypothetical protein